MTESENKVILDETELVEQLDENSCKITKVEYVKK